MMELTNEYIDSLVDKAKKDVSITPDNKAMTIIATFPCGWIMSSTANAVSGRTVSSTINVASEQKIIKEELYNKCLNDIKSEVWKLETYRKIVDNYKKTLKQEKNENEV